MRVMTFTSVNRSGLLPLDVLAGNQVADDGAAGQARSVAWRGLTEVGAPNPGILFGAAG